MVCRSTAIACVAALALASQANAFVASPPGVRSLSTTSSRPCASRLRATDDDRDEFHVAGTTFERGNAEGPTDLEQDVEEEKERTKGNEAGGEKPRWEIPRQDESIMDSHRGVIDSDPAKETIMRRHTTATGNEKPPESQDE
jgi:hypothetical protein